MPQNMFLASFIALGVAFTATQQVDAAQKKSHSAQHSASQKLKAPTNRSRAVVGDTCLGVSACNTLIAECVGSGLDFKPMQHAGPNGEPSYGQCVKRWD
jgi:hypothetical protein